MRSLSEAFSHSVSTRATNVAMRLRHSRLTIVTPSKRSAAWGMAADACRPRGGRTCGTAASSACFKRDLHEADGFSRFLPTAKAAGYASTAPTGLTLFIVQKDFGEINQIFVIQRSLHRYKIILKV